MNTQFLRNMLLVTTVLLIAGCANSPFYHRYVMAGQVVQASEGRSALAHPRALKWGKYWTPTASCLERMSSRKVNLTGLASG